MRNIVGMGLLTLCLMVTQAHAQQPNVQQINAVVKACVETTRAHQGPGGDAVLNPRFDAFYNPATGRVQDNVTMVFQQEYRFVFQKCMAEHGLPLGGGK
jgi:hypothetical protein